MSNETEFYVLYRWKSNIIHPGLIQKPRTENSRNPQTVSSYLQILKEHADAHSQQTDKLTIDKSPNDINNNNKQLVHMSSNNHARGLHPHKSEIVQNGAMKETKWSTEFVANLDSRTSPCVPSLDLTALTGEEDHDNSNTATKPQNGHKQYTHKKSVTEEALFTKKQRPAFVFPSEKSLADYDGGRTKHPHAFQEDPTTTNPFAQYKRSVSHDTVPLNGSGPMGIKGHDNAGGGKNGEKTLHFSLSNPSLRKYVLDDGDHRGGELSPQTEAETIDNEPIRRREESNKSHTSKTRDGILGATGVNEQRRRTSVSSDHLQEVIEVTVVNGYVHGDSAAVGESLDSQRGGTGTARELQLEEIVSAKEKPKLRVTFAFQDDIHSGRSVKRYTPVKTDVKPLHGVLKKRQEQNHVVPDVTDSYKDSKHDYFRDAGVVFRVDKKNEHLEKGIPVKHVHPTSSDLGLGEKRTKTSSTNVSGKPPIYMSNKISLSEAERSVSSYSEKGFPYTTNLTYVPNSHGRMAYFRPADGTRTAGDYKIRSKSVENVNTGDNRYGNNPNSGNNGRPGLPFTLRRCASSEHSLGSNNRGRPMKPRIAFGSFILPKETTPRLKQAQVKFHDMEVSHVPLGSYVHTHTRRSPYAAPAQVIYHEDIRRHTGSSSHRRPYTAQTKAQDQQKPSVNYGGQHVQRHSAPASYSSAAERSWRNSRQRLTIDSSPSRAPPPNSSAPKMGVSSGAYMVGDILPNKSKLVPGASVTSQGGKSGAETVQQRPDIAALNMMANKAKGASQYRFLATLKDKGHDHGAH